MPTTLYTLLSQKLSELHPATATGIWREIEHAVRTVGDQIHMQQGCDLSLLLDIFFERSETYYFPMLKEETNDNLVAMIASSFKTDWWNIVMELEKVTNDKDRQQDKQYLNT